MFWNKKKKEDTEVAPVSEATAKVDNDVFELEQAAYFGRRTRINTKSRGNLEQVKEYWQACREDGTLEALRALAPGDEQSFVAACTDFKSHEYEYWIAVKAPSLEAEPPEGFERLEAPEGEYAVFDCVGPAHSAVDDKWKYIYTKWFSKSTYNHGNGPELEIYPFGDMESEYYASKVLVPVRHMQPVGERYKRRNTMGGLICVAVGMMAGMLIGGNSENYMVYLIVGGLLGYFIFAYADKRIEEAKQKKAEEANEAVPGENTDKDK